jgi:hypothetical protein
VQFDKGKEGKGAAAGGGSVTASPRIKHSMKSLETMYGPLKRKEEKEFKDALISGHLPASPQKRKKGPPTFAANDAMIVVDPFSTGAILVGEVLSRGCKVIRVFAEVYPEHIQNLVLEGIRLEYVGTVQHKGDLAETVSQITQLKSKWNILGCTPGCETGVELADALSEALGLRTNGTTLSDCRRNKFMMNDQVRKNNVPSVLQQRASTIEQVNKFIKSFGSTFKLVIKPVASAGSDNVYVCRTPDEIRQRFEEIIGAENLLGAHNKEVVIQEFLEGKEYVVDTVSRDGVHKCVAVWEYDKRQANGRDFVYFGARLKSGNEPRAQELIKYQFKVLNALGINNGAGHAEVMYTPHGPRLVEVGARCHGAEGNWVPISNKCYGYSQVKVLVDCFLDPEAFELTPTYPMLGEFFGAKCDLVSRVDGKLIRMPRLDEVKALKTYFGMDILVKPGTRIRKTIDCITTPGSIRLCGQDKHDVEADFSRIREMEEENFFVVEPWEEGKSQK